MVLGRVGHGGRDVDGLVGSRRVGRGRREVMLPSPRSKLVEGTTSVLSMAMSRRPGGPVSSIGHPV